MDIDRRAFLALGAALGAATAARAQAPPAAMPAPAKAKITSAVMLWPLEGTFEDKVRAAAEAGLQSVGLADEYTRWDAAGLLRAKRFIESFGMSVETVGANPNWNTRPVSLVNSAEREGFLTELRAAIAAAKKLEAPYVVVVSGKEVPGQSRDEQYASLLEGTKRAGDLAAAAEVTLLVEPVSNQVERKRAIPSTFAEGLKLVKAVDSPHVRLLCSVFEEQAEVGNASGLREALEYASVVTVANAPGRTEPGTGLIDFKEVYKALQKAGYSHTVAMEYTPKGRTVASLKRAVDEFRVAVNERGASAVNPLNPTEGPFV